mgnify:FL=1
MKSVDLVVKSLVINDKIKEGFNNVAIKSLSNYYILRIEFIPNQ